MLDFRQTNVLLDAYWTLKHCIEQVSKEDKEIIIMQLEALRETFNEIDFNFQ